MWEIWLEAPAKLSVLSAGDGITPSRTPVVLIRQIYPAKLSSRGFPHTNKPNKIDKQFEIPWTEIYKKNSNSIWILMKNLKASHKWVHYSCCSMKYYPTEHQFPATPTCSQHTSTYQVGLRCGAGIILVGSGQEFQPTTVCSFFSIFFLQLQAWRNRGQSFSQISRPLFSWISPHVMWTVHLQWQ